MCSCNYRITLENGGGELDAREATTEEGARDAAIELLEATPFLSEGDILRVARS